MADVASVVSLAAQRCMQADAAAHHRLKVCGRRAVCGSSSSPRPLTGQTPFRVRISIVVISGLPRNLSLQHAIKSRVHAQNAIARFVPLPQAGLGVRADPGSVCHPPTKPAGTTAQKYADGKGMVVSGSSSSPLPRTRQAPFRVRISIVAISGLPRNLRLQHAIKSRVHAQKFAELLFERSLVEDSAE